MKQETLDERKVSLVKRFNQLTSTSTSILIEIEVSITKEWQCDDYGQVYISSNIDEILPKLQERQEEILDESIKQFINDVDLFVKDGGLWEEW